VISMASEEITDDGFGSFYPWGEDYKHEPHKAPRLCTTVQKKINFYAELVPPQASEESVVKLRSQFKKIKGSTLIDRYFTDFFYGSKQFPFIFPKLGNHRQFHPQLKTTGASEVCLTYYSVYFFSPNYSYAGQKEERSLTVSRHRPISYYIELWKTLLGSAMSRLCPGLLVA